MIVALDYDGTYTADPDMWDLFISTARLRGHSVIGVTMRDISEWDDGLTVMESKVDRMFYTCRAAKGPYLQSMGVIPTIWIDDMPQFITQGAS